MFFFLIFCSQLINEDFIANVISKTAEFSSLILRIMYYLSEMRYLHFVFSKVGVVESILGHLRGLNFRENEMHHEVDLDLGIIVFILCLHSVLNNSLL